MASKAMELIDQLEQKQNLSQTEFTLLLKNLHEEDLPELYARARNTKERHWGKGVLMRGLIEFSNYCNQNCLYCGIRAGNKESKRYRLSIQEILDCCHLGYELGYRTFVLQSGEDNHYSDEDICLLISKIKALYPDVAITLSIGEKEPKSYQRYYEAGADRYLLRHETASKRLYQELHPTMSFANRKQCLKTLQGIGFQVGAGFMVGLPGQTAEDLAQDLVFLKELDPDMVGIGAFLPHSQTPLAPAKGGTLQQTLVMVSLTRLLLPQSLLPATTALGTLDPHGRELALLAGANVVMPNLSPTEVRPLYELYENKICTGDEAAQCRGCIEGRINSIGMEVDMGRGDSLKYRARQS